MYSSAIWGLLGTIVGAIASIATAWLAVKSAHSLDCNRKKEEQREHSMAFQRQTILDLQHAVHDAVRAVLLVNSEEISAYRAGREWGKLMFSEEVNNEARLTYRKLFILSERVADDELRASVKRLMDSGNMVMQAVSEQSSKEQVSSLMQQAVTLSEEMGTVLRRHYVPAFVP